MNIRHLLLILLAGLLATSCSEKSAPDRAKDADSSETGRKPVRESKAENDEDELRPAEDKIEEDCAAFLRATKVVQARAANSGCPDCPADGTEALGFRQMKTDAVQCSGDTCTVRVTLHAVFNPATGETIAGGLTGWIPPDERSAYLRGQVPSGEQEYRVQITYKRRGGAWQAIEFERATAE